ncbi:hypothetical protein [Cohnella abietis]|uniref:Uncharacterized protein n=1 Tax=Cohnella abietis TaxID=2507935 RepID=A0A3T1D572_9BACL|nr:hypothetical protein [Cohnella abietis]BBI33247.1 hypothetical protein KCTCHS21_26460 [Cohnella abietis]
MDDKELFEQLARSPLTKNGFDEELRRKINHYLDNPKKKSVRPWFVRWSVLSASFLLIVVIVSGLWGWNSLSSNKRGELTLPLEQASSSSQPVIEREINPNPHSAVVIGLRKDSDQGALSSYRTIIIAPENNKLTFIRSGSGIYMPYKTHFWKVDTVMDSAGEGVQTIEATRADKVKKREASIEITAPLRRTEKLLFAGNHYLSILQTTNSDGYGYVVDHTKAWVNEVTALDPSVRMNDPESLQNNHITIANALGTTEVIKGSEEWAMVRDSYKWVGKQPNSQSIVNNASELLNWPTLSVALTEQATGPDTLSITGKQVLKLDRNAIDAYTSPAEDLIAIVADRRITLYPYQLKGAEMQELSVSVPIDTNESVVMVNWAVDERYVESWKQLFTKWFPKPTE